MNSFAFLLQSILAQIAQPSPTGGRTQETLLRLLQAGGWVMIPLIGASIITLTLILACFFTLPPRAVGTRPYMETPHALLPKRGYVSVITVSTPPSTATARIPAMTP